MHVTVPAHVGCLSVYVGISSCSAFIQRQNCGRPKLFYWTLAILVVLMAYEKTPKRTWIFVFFGSAYPILMAGLT